MKLRHLTRTDPQQLENLAVGSNTRSTQHDPVFPRPLPMQQDQGQARFLRLQIRPGCSPLPHTHPDQGSSIPPLLTCSDWDHNTLPCVSRLPTLHPPHPTCLDQGHSTQSAGVKNSPSQIQIWPVEGGLALQICPTG